MAKAPEALQALLCGAFAAAASAASLLSLPAPLGFIGAGLSIWLAYASYIDMQCFLLLDILTLPLILAGLVLASLGYGPSVLEACLGALIGFNAFWLVSTLYFKVRARAGLGLGDAKLMAAAGAWCGAMALPFVVLLGSVSALMWVGVLALRGRHVTSELKVPFGPFLSLGFFLAWLLGNAGALPF